MMKISGQTLTLLKNFSGINTGIFVPAGNRMRTVSGTKSILAEATVSETFPVDFAIYDLNQFLSAVSLFDDPDMDFGTNSVTISSGSKRVKYYYAERSMVITPPDKELPMNDVVIDFTLSSGSLQEILKASAVLQVPEVAVVSDGSGTTRLVALDTKNDTSNDFSIDVDHTSDESFKMVFRSENLKMLAGEYKLEITKQGIAKFTNTKQDLNYFVMAEASSKYGA
jgi:hypothetical protein